MGAAAVSQPASSRRSTCARRPRDTPLQVADDRRALPRARRRLVRVAEGREARARRGCRSATRSTAACRSRSPGLYDGDGRRRSSPTDGQRVCAPVHDRMPCVLAGPDAEAAWLSGEVERRGELLEPLAVRARVSVAPANPAVNKAGVEGAELLTPPPPSDPARSAGTDPAASDRVPAWTWDTSRWSSAPCWPLGIGRVAARRALAAARASCSCSGSGCCIGSDGLQLINFDDFEARPRRSRRSSRSRCILYEGGLSSGWAEIRPVIGVVGRARDAGHARHRGADRARGDAAVRDLSTLEALLLGSHRGRDRRRRGVRGPARLDAAARLARTLEGESGVNDPVAVLLVLGCIEAIQHAELRARATRSGWRSGALDRRRRRPRGRRARRVMLPAPRALPSAGLYPVASIALGRARVRRRATRCTAPASSPSTSRGW